MTDKEFLCTIYDSNLVDHAIEESKDFYKEHEAEMLYKMATTAEMLPNKTGASEIYDHIQQQMVFSYLRGASYAVSYGLSSTDPSEEQFSEFHKNVDFAVLFNFSDNDFGLAMEAGAKVYCDEFNGLLRQIDLYNDHAYMRDSYIKRFEEICKVKNIKEIMKCGFMSERMKNQADATFKVVNTDDALDIVRSDMNYIPWDGTRKIWEKSMDDYFVKEEVDRFITGTNEEISEALKKYGHPDENPKRPFPVWCNGEVIILYMSDGYLKYVIR